MDRPGPIMNVGARRRGLIVIDEGAFEDVDVLAPLVRWRRLGLIAGIELPQQGLLPGLRIMEEDLLADARPDLFPLDGIAIDVGDQVARALDSHDVILLYAANSRGNCSDYHRPTFVGYLAAYPAARLKTLGGNA